MPRSAGDELTGPIVQANKQCRAQRVRAEAGIIRMA